VEAEAGKTGNVGQAGNAR